LTASINEANSNMSNATKLMSAFSAGGGDDDDEGDKKAKIKTPEEIYNELAGEYFTKLPECADLGRVEMKYGVDYHECLNTVLLMELGKMNKLLGVLRATLDNLQKAVKGLVVFSPDLEEVGHGLLNNKIPPVWLAVSYPCLKPLGSYILDHLERWKFFHHWIENGSPIKFWFSAYFFQQAFLTGVMQNFARKEKIAIDKCTWNYEVLKFADSDPTEKPSYGAYSYGFFMDGARWDDDNGFVTDSFPKVLWSELPNVWLKPVDLINDTQNPECVLNQKMQLKAAKARGENPEITGFREHVYPAPVYKESLRRGVLSTSGHSSNFILWLFIKMADEHIEQFWTKRGVALITMTDE